MSHAADIASLDWQRLAAELDAHGHAVTAPILSAAYCAELARLYDDPAIAFRTTVQMARHGYGEGEYRYFAEPLPERVSALREAFYPPLREIANRWAERLGREPDWPASLAGLSERCRAAGQTRPTPLLLRYGPGDYNCLHQDRYGAVQFPLQVVLLLSAPTTDFDGGELVLVEQRPRAQSRAAVVPLAQGCAAVIPSSERPVAGKRGDRRVQMRHGVSRILRGRRTTLGLIFHDAA